MFVNKAIQQVRKLQQHLSFHRIVSALLKGPLGLGGWGGFVSFQVVFPVAARGNVASAVVVLAGGGKSLLLLLLLLLLYWGFEGFW